MTEIDEQYFAWMLNKIFEDELTMNTYLAVAREMHSILFEFNMCLDENRQKDAQDLRYRFGNENGYSEAEICRSLDMQAPTLFEMLVALLERVQDSVLCDFEIKVTNQEIFVDILKSLKIDHIKGPYNMSGDEASDFYDAIYKLYSKKYSYYGEGGLFTVSNPKADMRETDIWYQFMWYLDEKLGGKYL